MIRILKLIALVLFILVGYHYFNQSLGLSIAQSLSLIIFAICLLALYEPYQADTKNWFGWFLIIVGCLALSFFKDFNYAVIIPVFSIILGYRLAELYMGVFSRNNISGGGDSFGGDAGGCDFGGDSGGGGE